MFFSQRILFRFCACFFGLCLSMSMMGLAQACDQGYFQPQAVPNLKDNTPYPYAYPYPHPYPGLWQTPRLENSHYQVFKKPRLGQERLDFCYDKDKYCGRAAANAYCQSQGYRYATRFYIERDQGLTRNIRDGYVDLTLSRDGFREIRCRA